MERIKIGVIGLGWFGEHHVDTLLQLPLAEVAAICTRRPDHLKKMSDKYNIKKTYTNYRDMLDDKNIDMVSIVTHVSDHSQIAIDSINAGKHVFLEKPMASTVEECDKIIEALGGTDKCFMVGHICRFDTAYALAKEEIDSGSIGKIVSIYAKRNLAKWITESSLNKISALFGDGIHDFDLMLWYTKAKPKTVYAKTTNTRPEFKYDDIAWALFTLDNGTFAVIENIWSLPDNVPYAIDAKMEIIGTEGAICIDNSGSHYAVLTKKGLSYPQSTYWPTVHGIRRGYLKEEFDYFLKCIANNEKPKVITPKESRDVVFAMRMAEKSSAENKIIEF
ncbi:MAG: Gfo/Idh/MocA family oxidoreductase [Actinomycetota bacterium]|nr:Gfo/Idh/MocA family oxidoreductase [Actinomycetota bacterium]